jgi:hypothetical protein
MKVFMMRQTVGLGIWPGQDTFVDRDEYLVAAVSSGRKAEASRRNR